MSKLVDRTNKMYGLLHVDSLDRLDSQNRSWWKCTCKCGNVITVRSDNLYNKTTHSCGCDITKYLSDKPRIHNTSGTRGVYHTKRTNKWFAMIMLNSKQHYLGTYDNKQDAINARKKAEETIWQPFIDATKGE